MRDTDMQLHVLAAQLAALDARLDMMLATLRYTAALMQVVAQHTTGGSDHG